MARGNKQEVIRIANKAGVAEFFDVSLKAVDDWIRKGCPVIQQGGKGVSWEIDLLAVAQWRYGKPKDEENDPDKMSPEKRLKFYQAEQARDELLEKRRLLIPAEEVERGTAELVKSMVSLLETLPDVLERDAGIQPHATAQVIKAIDGFRNEAYSKLSESEEVAA